MIEFKALKKLFLGTGALAILTYPAMAGDQAKAIVNAIDPKSMNELLQMSRSQPDAALTNIVPVAANKFRFIFIWPASNPLMTYDRIGRSFAERFVGLTDSLKLLAKGYCLSSKTMYFGSTPYGEEAVNVAYRDIEVHFNAGWQAPCPGRYVSAADIEESEKAASGARSAEFPRRRPQDSPPEESLKPFLTPLPTPP